MTPAHFKALAADEVWGGSGEAWSMALIVVMGYQSSKAADEARGAKVKHTWADLSAALEGAELEEIWQGGAWRGEERGEEDEEGGGAPMPAEFANWLKENKMAVVPAACFAQAHASARAKEDKKRASAPAVEPEDRREGKRIKRGGLGECRFGAECKRHRLFLAGARKAACPDGSH